MSLPGPRAAWLLGALGLAGVGATTWWLLRPARPTLGGLGSVDVSGPPLRPKPPPPESEDGGAAVTMRAPWGSGPGELGRGDDQDHVGPMSLAADAHGNLLVLDAANRRVARFDKHGAPQSPVVIGQDSARDLAVGADGRVLVLDRKHGDLRILAPDSHLIGSVLLVGSGVRDADQVTAVFADRDGSALIEVDHRRVMRITGADGLSLAARPSLPGRPRRDFTCFLSAAISDRRTGTVGVRALDDQGRTRWETPVSFGAPLLRIALLDSDESGRTYVAGDTGRESPTPPDRLIDLRTTVIMLDPDGTPRGTLALPGSADSDESRRSLAISGAGTLYRMRTGDAGVTIESYRF